MGNKNAPKIVAIIQHSRFEPANTLERLFESHRIPYQIFRTYQNDKLPKAADISGLLSLGGAMHANDDALHPWIPQECALLAQLVAHAKPVLGICLGGQLLARALGGRVIRHHKPEIGWHEITLNSEVKLDPNLSTLDPRSIHVYQWHYDTFIPRASEPILAESNHCERQMFRAGLNAYGLQFHPEVDVPLLKRWHVSGSTEKEVKDAVRTHGDLTIQSLKKQLSPPAEIESDAFQLLCLLSQIFLDLNLDEAAAFAGKNPPKIGQFVSVRMQGKRIAIEGKLVCEFKGTRNQFLVLRDKKDQLWGLSTNRIASVEIKRSKPAPKSALKFAKKSAR